jgi:hypothetical protein
MPEATSIPTPMIVLAPVTLVSPRRTVSLNRLSPIPRLPSDWVTRLIPSAAVRALNRCAPSGM